MNIALVAHDSRKEELLEWIKFNYKVLEEHNLYATGTTGRLIESLEFDVEVDEYGRTLYEHVSPFKGKVTCLLSGPLGGDAMIGGMIAQGQIDCLFFWCDNLIVQGHNSDIQGLSRLASLYNIAFATNRTTADLIISSPLFFDSSYKRSIPGCIEDYKNRKI